MNNIGMLTELELKDRLYTVRQQKRVLENRLENIPSGVRLLRIHGRKPTDRLEGELSPPYFMRGL